MKYRNQIMMIIMEIILLLIWILLVVTFLPFHWQRLGCMVSLGPEMLKASFSQDH